MKPNGVTEGECSVWWKESKGEGEAERERERDEEKSKKGAKNTKKKLNKPNGFMSY